MPQQQRLQLVGRRCDLGLRSMEIDDVVREELASLVYHGDLAAGAKPGVDSQHRDWPGWRRQQQVLQVVAEDLDGFRVGALFQFEADLPLDGRVQQSLPRIFYREFELRSPVTRLAQEARTQH